MNNYNHDALADLHHKMEVTAKRMQIKAKGVTSTPTRILAPLNKPLGTPASKRTPKSHSKIDSKEKTPKIRKAPASRMKMNRILRRPAGYTWNRGGRLKEIRIRTQARKFLTLWKLKTFGRVLPSKAATHRRQAVLRVAFLQWKEIWWEARVEWKLTVRAEYHYRYSLYSIVWLQWRFYTMQQKAKKEKYTMATDHSKIKILQFYIDSWKVYVQQRRTEHDMDLAACQARNANLMKSTWVTWKACLQEARQRKTDQETALFHWISLTQKQVWRQWLKAVRHKITSRDQIATAKQHHSFWLLRSHFRAWFQHRTAWKTKQTTKKFATCVRNRNLARHAILVWQRRWQRTQQLKEQANQINDMSERSVLRRYLSAWVVYLNLRREKRKKWIISEQHHRIFLLKKALYYFGQNVLLMQRKEHMYYVSVRHYKLNLLRKTWLQWQRELDQIEDSKMATLIDVANQHHSINVMQLALRQWKAYLQYRKKRKELKLIADSHYIVKVLPIAFEKWKKYISKIKQANERQSRADVFRRETLHAKYFYTWWILCDQSLEARTLERIAILHHRKLTMTQVFIYWKTRAKVKMLNMRSEAVADSCYREILLHRSLNHWKVYRNLEKQKRRKIIRAVSYHYHSTLAGSWIAWRSFVSTQNRKKKQWGQAMTHRRTHLLGTCFTQWKQYHDQIKSLHHTADNLIKSKQELKLRKVFTKWKEATRTSLTERRKEKGARQLYERHELAKTFRRWRIWSAMNAYQHQQKEERFSEIQRELNEGKTRCYFQRWKQNMEISRMDRLKRVLADDHYRLKICRVVLQIWKVYRYLQIKKTLMEEQATNFRNQELIRSCFHVWNTRLGLQREEQERTGDALWHWAMSVQSKMFNAWVSYTSERRRKNSRYEEAMQRRRVHLLRKGCIKMLESHSSQIYIRTKMGAMQKAQSTYAGYHLAWKFAKKWRFLVQERSKHRASHNPVQTNFDTTLRKLTLNPMLYPVSETVTRTSPRKTASRRQFENVAWTQEPRLPVFSQQMPKLSSQTHSIDPSDPHCAELLTQNKRPVPRGPDFLMDSLQREGLDGEIEFTPRLPIHSTPHVKQYPDNTHLPILNHEEPPEPQEVAPTLIGGTNQEAPLTQKNPLGDAVTPVLKNGGYNLQVDEPIKPPPQVTLKETKFTPRTDVPNVILLPPSVFTVSPQLETPTPLGHFHETTSDTHTNSFESASSSGEYVLQTMGLPELPTDPIKVKSSTNQTFYIPSPQSTNMGHPLPMDVELQQIRREMKEYQQLKEDLRVLKNQKELLEKWLREDNHSSCNSSIYGSVHDEMNQMMEDIHEIAHELQTKRPHIEKLALRVKVLSAGPT